MSAKIMKIKTRLIIAFGVVIVCFVFLSLLSKLTLEESKEWAETLYAHPLPVSNAALKANINVVKIHSAMKDLLLAKNESDLNREIANINELEKQVFAELDVVAELIVGVEGQNLEKETRAYFEQWRPLREQVIAHLKEGDRAAAEKAGKEKCSVHLENFEDKITAIQQYAKNRADKYIDSIRNILKRTELVFFIVIFVIPLCLGTFVFIFLIRGINAPLEKAISILKETSEQVSLASGQVSSVSQSLSGRSSEQAAAVEETAASVEEISSMSKQNSDNADRADSFMREVRQLIEKATESMKKMISSMAEITRASEESFRIVKTIDEIAFQTNLLSLNAAVEAARAGEAGAGFAVVAGEVKNLAARSAEAAKNTSTLIESTVKKIRDGSELVAQTGNAFSEVACLSSKVGDLIGEIAAASNEQTRGIDQLNISASESDKITQQNAADAEESASISEEMYDHAEKMKALVDSLAALIGESLREKRTAAYDEEYKRQHLVKKVHRISPARVSPILSPEKKRSAIDRTEEVRPEQIIPLDEDDFKGF